MIEKIHLLAILWSIKTHTSTITKLKNYIGNISIIYTEILPEEKYQKIKASYFYGNLLAQHDFTRRIIEYPLAPAPLSLHWPADRSFLDPVHTQPGTLGNGDFFSSNTATVHVYPAFSGTPKRRFSNTLSRVESFEIEDLSYACGRAKTKVFKYDDVMPWFKTRSSAHTIRKRYMDGRKQSFSK